MKQQQAIEKNQTIQKKATQLSVKPQVSDRVPKHPRLQSQGLISNHTLLRYLDGELYNASILLPNSRQIAMSGINSAASPVPYKTQMEGIFDTDFDNIKTFTNTNSQKACRIFGVEAYTFGRNIAFSTRNPKQSIVAHELTHILQQRNKHSNKRITNKSDSAEKEAKGVEKLVETGHDNALPYLAFKKNYISDNTLAFYTVDTDPCLHLDNPRAFWHEVRQDTRTQIIAWADGDIESAITHFADRLSGQARSNLALEIFFRLLGFVPRVGAIIHELFFILRGVYDHLQRSRSISLGDLLVRLRDNKSTILNSVNSSDFLSQEIDNLITRDHTIRYVSAYPEQYELLQEEEVSPEETSIYEEEVPSEIPTQEQFRTRILSNLNRTVIELLPNWRVITRPLVLDWINSAQDSWDIGADAGVVEVITGLNLHNFHMMRSSPPFIDDVTNPQGTIDLMEDAFGGSTYLDDIRGIRMRIIVIPYSEHPLNALYTERRRYGTIVLTKPSGIRELRIHEDNFTERTISTARRGASGFILPYVIQMGTTIQEFPELLPMIYRATLRLRVRDLTARS